MAEVTAAAVKSLRDRTDLPMMQCKKALVEAGGDEEKAIAILSEKMRVKVKSRSDNEVKEGRIFIESSDDGQHVGVVELRCESEPVSGSEGFLQLGAALVKTLANTDGVATPDELFAQTTADGQTLQAQFDDVNTKIQEKFELTRVARHSAPCGVYVHHNGKVAAVFCAEDTGNADDATLEDIAKHVAAMRPVAMTEADVPAELVETERSRLTEDASASGKPANIVEKIVDGQMKKWLKDDAGVLLEQQFVFDDSKTVRKMLDEKSMKPKHFDLFVIE